MGAVRVLKARMDTRTGQPAGDRQLLTLPVFRQLWGGDFLARLGYQICEFLFPLIAVVKLHSSGVEAGLISASQFVPVIVFALIAGAVADQAETRSLMLVSSIVRGAMLGLLGLVYGLGGLGFLALLIAAMVVGSATVFYDVGFQSAIPRLLSSSELARGNGLLQASTSATQLAGPTLAGLLLSAAGLPFALGATGAMFAGAIVAFGFLRSAAMPSARDAGGAQGTGTDRGWRTVFTGLKYSWGCREIRDLCLQSGFFNLHEQAFVTAFLLFGVRTAHLSAGVVGILLGIASAGALIGSIVAGRLSVRLHAGASLTTGLVTASAMLLIGPLLTPALPVIPVFGTAFLLNGLALGTYNVYAISLRQAIPPRRFVGSATASYRMVSLGLVPVGALAGGALADAYGPHAALLIIAASMTCVSLLLLSSPVKRIRSVHDAAGAAS